MIICVVGPTGVGKTKMSVALAKKYNAIIVNCDATQVYKELDIGSAKATKEEQEGIEHYLLDFKNLNESYTVYEYQKDARKIIENNKDKNIIFVGGTGLYLKAALYDYRFTEEDDNHIDYKDKTNEELYNIALKKGKEDPELFALGLIASVLEKNEIETAIVNDDYIKKEKEKENIKVITKEETQKQIEKKRQEENEAITSLQFLTNGWIGKKKYDLSFDFDDNRVNEILFDPIEYNNFKKKLIDKICKDYNVPKDKIIVTFPQMGSLRVQVIFQSDEFNDLNPDEFKEKFKNDKDFEELRKIKEVQTGVIMSGCKLSKAQLDIRGNRIEWPKNEKRGGEKYNAPEGWIGIGLKVFDKYENDQWIDMQNQKGEWVVAYHGVGNLANPKDVVGIPASIYQQGFKIGKRQAHKDCDDYFHPGQKVGEGIYCTPRIDIAEQYAGNSEFNGVEYKTVIMCRVNPKARRHCYKCEESRVNEYWVVNGTPDEIRPYRILYKCDELMTKLKKTQKI